MDTYSASFTYPKLSWPLSDLRSKTDAYSVPQQPQPSDGPLVDATVETIQKTTIAAMQQHGCLISSLKFDHGWNFHLTGSYQQVMAARGTLLREVPIQSRASIKVYRHEILDDPLGMPSLKTDVRRQLDEIASKTQAHVAVLNDVSGLLNAHDDMRAAGQWDSENVCELVITGSSIRVDAARVQVLILLDKMSGLHAEPIDVDPKLQAIVAGRKRTVLQSIQEETATNIYLSSPLGASDPVALTPPGAQRAGRNAMWITGEFFGVQRAKDMILQLVLTKGNTIVSCDAALLPRKLDWMILDRSEDIRTIMNDDGTYIKFPPVGSQTSLITVFGETRVNVQRTIRSIMHLACQHYIASFWLLPVHFNPLLPSTVLNPAQMPTVLQSIAGATGAEVVLKGNSFEMYGLEQEVRAAVSMILELDIVKSFHHEIRFQLELANEHRDFISGKKNGKINKIMQTANVKTKFETFNEHNFLIDIAGTDATALQGLSLLQEELPAEISFHVPESYHKRIIGVGGKSIQRIMKRYGVYVKFSSSEDLAALGGYKDIEDNVIARTPAKNAINLDNLRQAVMELVNPKDKDYGQESIVIPRRYHRTLLGEKSIFLRDIENKTSCRFRFPDKELGSDVVAIYGPESQAHIAVAMLLEHVPFESEMSVRTHPDLNRLCASQDFVSLVDSIKRDYQVVVTPVSKFSGNGSPSGAESAQVSFKFQCQRSSCDYLPTARELLEQFLASHHIPIYPPARSHLLTHKRGDSFTDAFPHFDSKILSTPYPTDGSAPDRRLRLATSTPNVKSLFNNSPSYVYKLEDQEELDEGSVYGSDYWTPLPPIGSGMRVPRTRQTEDALKRGSDSRLEAKLKDQSSKPRTLNNRAQSLDLTFSLSKISEVSSSVPEPESPTNSTGGSAGTSSPTSVGAPSLSFPSVYAPPSARQSATGPSLARAAQGQEVDTTLEEVNRVIANLGL